MENMPAQSGTTGTDDASMPGPGYEAYLQFKAQRVHTRQVDFLENQKEVASLRLNHGGVQELGVYANSGGPLWP